MFRFSNLCQLCNNIVREKPSVNFQRYYRRGTNNARTRRPSAKIQAKIQAKKQLEYLQENAAPIIVCKRKEFNLYEGQKYRKYDEIELASKGWHRSQAKGDYFLINPIHDVAEEPTEDIPSFEQCNLDPLILERLRHLGFKNPTRIQADAIPKIMNGTNTILAAETGCGKTLAYGIPMVQQVAAWKLLMHRRYNSPIGLIVTPTRELASQIATEINKIARVLGVRTKVLMGGKTTRMMRDPPVDKVDILISSFGVINKLHMHRIYKLRWVRHVVLDEADALFHETFEVQVSGFIRKLPIAFEQYYAENGCPLTAQMTVASATVPSRMSNVLGGFLNVDSFHHVTTSKLHRILIPQKFIRVGPGHKPAELLKFVKPKVSNRQSVIVYCNKSKTCDWVSIFLDENNINNVSVHGDMPLKYRLGKYGLFKSGKVLVLCTTNAGSRGLDTIMVRHVLNYEFPFQTAEYIHRCGRAGRMGDPNHSRVTNFISDYNEVELTQKIERAVRKGKPIPIIDTLNPDIKEEQLLSNEAYRARDDVEEIVDIDAENSIPY